jgi:hypothetical protein
LSALGIARVELTCYACDTVLRELAQDIKASSARLSRRPGADEAGPAPVGQELPAGAGGHKVLELFLAEVGAVAFGQVARFVREHVQALRVGVLATAGKTHIGRKTPATSTY